MKSWRGLTVSSMKCWGGDNLSHSVLQRSRGVIDICKGGEKGSISHGSSALGIRITQDDLKR